MNEEAKTIEQLQAEAAAARAALAEAEEKAEKLRKEEKLAVERAQKLAEQKASIEAKKAEHEKLLAALLPVFEAVKAELAKRKIEAAPLLNAGTVSFSDEYGLREALPAIDGLGHHCEIRIERHRRGRVGGWRLGREEIRLTVGVYGDALRFPLKKDGSFSADKIAIAVCDRLQNRLADQKRIEERDANRKASNEIAQRLRKEFGLPDYSNTVKQSDFHASKVNVTINAAMSEEHAREILALLQKWGVK